MHNIGTTVRQRIPFGVASISALLIVLNGSTIASAAPPPTYTGCLNSADGTIRNVTVGVAPLAPCKSGEIELTLSSGDITAVQAGNGLTGGGDGGPVALTVDTENIQTRVRKDCSQPEVRGGGLQVVFDASIMTINADGSVVCNVDDGLRQVSQGFGLNGNGTFAQPLEVDATAVQTRVSGFACDTAGRSIKKIDQDGSADCTLGPKVAVGQKPGRSSDPAGCCDLATNFAQIGALPLPTGKFLIMAKVALNSTKIDPMNEVLGGRCELRVTDVNGNLLASPRDEAIAWGDNDLFAGGTLTMFAWADSVGFGPKAVVRCQDGATGSNIVAQMEWRDLKIVALQLDAGGVLEVPLQ